MLARAFLKDATVLILRGDEPRREQGAHADLVAQDGLYARLVASQISGAKTIGRNAARSERL